MSAVPVGDHLEPVSAGRHTALESHTPGQTPRPTRRLATLSYREAGVIGFFQILALLAGISRSGITMVGGLARGLSHRDAARFSFLLATPIILAAGPVSTSRSRNQVAAPLAGGDGMTGRQVADGKSLGRPSCAVNACPVDPFLQTERLTLRHFTVDDADLLIELDSDPAVMRYLTGGEPTEPTVVRELHLPSILGVYERCNGKFGLFAAHEKDSGVFIGSFCLRPQRGGPIDEVELGYRLRRRPGARVMPPKAQGLCWGRPESPTCMSCTGRAGR